MKFTACQRALELALAPPPVGQLTEALVECFNEYLQNLAEQAENANQNRLEYVRPFLEILHQTRTEAVHRLQALVKFAPAADLLEFERLIRASRIIQEVDAFNRFVVAPTSIIGDSEKVSKGEEIAKSLKEVLKKLRKRAKKWGWPFNAQEIADLFDALDEAIDEVLKLLTPPPTPQ